MPRSTSTPPLSLSLCWFSSSLLFSCAAIIMPEPDLKLRREKGKKNLRCHAFYTPPLSLYLSLSPSPRRDPDAVTAPSPPLRRSALPRRDAVGPCHWRRIQGRPIAIRRPGGPVTCGARGEGSATARVTRAARPGHVRGRAFDLTMWRGGGVWTPPLSVGSGSDGRRRCSLPRPSDEARGIVRMVGGGTHHGEADKRGWGREASDRPIGRVIFALLCLGGLHFRRENAMPLSLSLPSPPLVRNFEFSSNLEQNLEFICTQMPFSDAADFAVFFFFKTTSGKNW